MIMRRGLRLPPQSGGKFGASGESGVKSDPVVWTRCSNLLREQERVLGGDGTLIHSHLGSQDPPTEFLTGFKEPAFS